MARVSSKEEQQRDEFIQRQVSRMTHRDLQSACILKGMPFKDIVEKDHHGLVSWYFLNFELNENPQNLIEYDQWLEGQLEKKGYKKGDAMLSPSLRFSYTKGIDDSPVKTQRIQARESNKSTEPKSQQEHKVVQKDEITGVRVGTKKNLTFQLARKVPEIPIDKIIEQVIEAFPDAQDKSIKIWVKRARKPESNE